MHKMFITVRVCLQTKHTCIILIYTFYKNCMLNCPGLVLALQQFPLVDCVAVLCRSFVEETIVRREKKTIGQSSTHFSDSVENV